MKKEFDNFHAPVSSSKFVLPASPLWTLRAKSFCNIFLHLVLATLYSLEYAN